MQRFKADKLRYQAMIQCPDDDQSKKGGIDVVGLRMLIFSSD
jgi:hypothetical protein